MCLCISLSHSHFQSLPPRHFCDMIEYELCWTFPLPPNMFWLQVVWNDSDPEDWLVWLANLGLFAISDSHFGGDRGWLWVSADLGIGVSLEFCSITALERSFDRRQIYSIESFYFMKNTFGGQIMYKYLTNPKL